MKLITLQVAIGRIEREARDVGGSDTALKKGRVRFDFGAQDWGAAYGLLRGVGVDILRISINVSSPDLLLFHSIIWTNLVQFLLKI